MKFPLRKPVDDMDDDDMDDAPKGKKGSHALTIILMSKMKGKGKKAKGKKPAMGCPEME